MKKINLNSMRDYLSRDEMRELKGGSGPGTPISCIYYSGCSTGCLYRYAKPGGFGYACNYCCVA